MLQGKPKLQKMTSFRDRIEKSLFRKKEKTGLDVFHEVCFVLAKELGWSYQDIINAPTPFVLAIVEHLNDYNQRQEKAMSKGRK